MSESPKPSHDPAKARFLAITLIRWTGVGLVMLGLLITTGRVVLPPEIRQVVGPALVLFGLFDALVMPTLLARRWKSPDA
jgi:hypothetical protein